MPPQFTAMQRAAIMPQQFYAQHHQYLMPFSPMAAAGSGGMSYQANDIVFLPSDYGAPALFGTSAMTPSGIGSGFWLMPSPRAYGGGGGPPPPTPTATGAAPGSLPAGPDEAAALGKRTLDPATAADPGLKRINSASHLPSTAAP